MLRLFQAMLDWIPYWPISKTAGIAYCLVWLISLHPANARQVRKTSRCTYKGAQQSTAPFLYCVGPSISRQERGCAAQRNSHLIC
jgi:hypothetical protein